MNKLRINIGKHRGGRNCHRQTKNVTRVDSYVEYRYKDIKTLINKPDAFRAKYVKMTLQLNNQNDIINAMELLKHIEQSMATGFGIMAGDSPLQLYNKPLIDFFKHHPMVDIKEKPTSTVDK